MAQHFVQPPDWTWYIVGYFFVAGIAGGAYTLATMLRLWGSGQDAPTARIGYLLAFPLAAIGGLFLTLDLGQPLRFWHMLVNTTPDATGINFYYWSPISLGSWALLAFSFFAFVSFVEALTVRTQRVGSGMIAFNALGSLLGLFLASYTGVVLSVSNQPVWSDSYAVGGLFVASALSSGAAVLSWFSHYRSGIGAAATERRLAEADGYFAVLELLMIVAFFTTLANAGTLYRELAPVWVVLWVLVLASLVPALRGLRGRRIALAGDGGAVATASAAAPVGIAGAIIVLVGVLLLRIVVIFSAQF